MPFWYLYGLANVLFFFLYRVLGYRKEVVISNIKRSFPEKSDAEHKHICKQFYKHLTRIIVESIKTFSISEKNVLERFVVKNPEEVNRHFDAGRSVILAGGHYCNWEWVAVALDQQIKHAAKAVYFPLKNSFLNEKMKASRSKFGLEMIIGKQVRPVFTEAKQNKQPVAMILATDQSPSNPNNAYWMEFLNQDTGVLFGTEKYAKEFNVPVVFGSIQYIKKGYYEVTFKTLVEDPSQLAYGEITERHTKELENAIIEKPEFWLWSHKRWKKKRPENANQPR